MDENKKVVRVPFNLHRNNPRHEEVYHILERAENKNAYIREAVLFYYQHKDDSFHESVTLDEIEGVIQKCNEDMLLQLRNLMDAQNGLDYEKMRNIF